MSEVGPFGLCAVAARFLSSGAQPPVFGSAVCPRLDVGKCSAVPKAGGGMKPWLPDDDCQASSCHLPEFFRHTAIEGK